MPFTEIDLPFVFETLRQAAVGEIMSRFARLEAGEIRTKAHATDFVTVADEAAERFICDRMAARWPGAVLVGEESVEKTPELIHAVKGAEMAIVIDPIDGTFNFASGIPAFAVLFSIVENNQTRLGVLYDPVRDDFIWAMPGRGAFAGATVDAGRRLRVCPADKVGHMHGAVSWYYMQEPLRSRVVANSGAFWGTYGYRCGGQEMRLMATGGCHFLVYAKLSPWDHIAGVLVLQEAGAHVAHLDGSPYQPGDLDGGLLFAPDQASWTIICDTLFRSG